MSSEDDSEIESLLDCFMVHKLELIRPFFQSLNQNKSGTKEILRERLRPLLSESKSNVVLLTAYLNVIEGWGNQHIYLYTSTAQACENWKKQSFVVPIFKRNSVLRIVNKVRPVVLPESPTLSSIVWNQSKLRLIWNEKRTWFERREELDRESEDQNLVYRAWEPKTARGTTSFDWDLDTGEAMILIQKLPSGTKYHEIRDQVISRLGEFFDFSIMEPTRVNKSIKKILEGNEVRERKTNWETVRGGRASLISSGKRQSVRQDQTLKAMEAAGRQNLQGSLGNMYWLKTPGGEITEEIHTVIHKKDQRVSILGERSESEVQYVTRRIRSYSR